MMFRSAHVGTDEESGSDWDDYTPQASPLHSGPSTLAPVPGNSSPPVDLTEKKASKPHFHQPSSIINASTPHSAVFEDHPQPLSASELTSIATVSTPHPPPPTTPPSAKNVYRVQQHVQDKGELSIQFEESTGNLDGVGNMYDGKTGDRHLHSSSGQRSPRPGSRSSTVLGAHSSKALKFSSVSDASSKHLLPSMEPAYSYMSSVADKSEQYSQRCVQECFSSIRIVSDFLIAVLLACTHYTVHHLIRKLLCGLSHIFSDSLFKPFISLSFNGFLWPVMSLCVQLSKAVGLVARPLLDIVHLCFASLAQVARACRLVTINNGRLSSKVHSNA